jgi:hypothetical protein
LRPEQTNTVAGVTYAACGLHIRIVSTAIRRAVAE